MSKGFATAEGTARYRDRFPKLRQASHFRIHPHVPSAGELWLSSIGLGTYLGEPDAAADQEYAAAIVEALRSGINILDTAINYRHQRSERNIGAAVRQLLSAGEFQRDEVIVCTKAGYLSFDADMPADPRAYFKHEYLQPGILNLQELAGGMHCMAPRYLADQIERSRRNLGLDTIDVFYIHNPETQLSAVDRATFLCRLKAAFETLEKSVAAEAIRYYGVATWNGFRVSPTARDYLSLDEIVNAARETAGDAHHFRFIQLPYNLAMLEAYGYRNQGPEKQLVSTLERARKLGVLAVGSATISQGQLTAGLPEFIGAHLGMESDAANAIQFSRSTPGVSTSLIGMRRKEHVAENVKVAHQPIAPAEQWGKLFEER